MKKSLPMLRVFLSFLLFFLSQNKFLLAQCNNADFESGTLSGWTGTYGDGTCVGVVDPILGLCIGCYTPDPFQHPTLNQGPNNQPATGLPVKNHFIMSSGYDPTAGGTVLPVVHTPGLYSARLGDAHADDAGHGGGESMSYTFTVNANNCNFTYHYAVVLKDGGHNPGEQPYFKIRMYDGSNNLIDCATYDVDATTAQSIGGFVTVGGTSYKTWTSVFIPLNNYIGQTVRIQFTTRDCAPTGCDGSHWAYAYIDADCNPLQIVSSSPTICGGQNITLSAPAGAATYSWTGPGVVPPGNTQIVTVNQAGHYTVNMTTFGTVPCNFSLDTVIPGSPGNPVASFSATTVCVGSPTTFTDNSTPVGGVNGWAWDFDNNGTPDAVTQNPTHTFPSAGTYPVRLVAAWPPCLDDTTINVVVSPAPTSTFTATSPLCVGTNSTVTYTGNAPANATYTWNFDGGTVVSGSGQGPYSVNWASGGTKNITLTVTIGSCASSVTTVQVVVNPFPGTAVSPNVSICTGGSTVLTATGGTSYTWTPATDLSATTGATVTASPTITTTYTVTGVNANCTSPASVTVTVTPIPTSPFTATTPVCVGQTSTITYTGNATTGATYTWNFAGGTVVSGSGQGPYTISWATGGTKAITLTVDENGCSSPLTTVNVVVNPSPTSVFTVVSPVCTGQNSTITYTGNATAGATYTWSFSGGTVVSGSGQGPYQVNWATGGTKTITLSVTENGCSSAPTNVDVVVGVIPTSAFTASSPLCVGQNSTVAYTGNATSGATYNWNFDGGTVVSGTGQGPYQVNWGTSGTKNITLTVVENGCSSTPTTVSVTVNPTSSSSFTTVSPVCTGQSSTITYTGTGTGGAVYTWGFDGGTVVSGTGQGPYDVNWSTAGTKNVTLNVTENGCFSNTTVTVVVNVIPTSLFTAASPVCTGNNSTVTYTGNATPGATYTWGFDGGNVVSGSGQGPYTVNWATAGVKNLTLTVSENGCTSTAGSGSVTVNAIPVSDAGADVTYCSGSSAPLGTAPNAGYTYSWQPANGLSTPTVSNPDAVLTNTTNAVTTTTFTVTTSENGCFSTDDVVVTVIPLPLPAINTLAGQCLTGNNFAFQAGGSFIGSAAFAWDFSASGTPPVSSSQNQSVVYSAPGTYPVTLTVTQNTCTGTASSSVDVYAMPLVNFTADTLFGCENLPVCFTDNSTGTSALTYQWSFGDGMTSALQNPCHTFSAPGTYTVALSVVSAEGCSGSNTVPDMITVIADPTAAFSLSSTIIQLPQTTLEIENLSQNAVTYLWMFGDSGTSTAVTPGAATFTSPGYYPITLFAYNQLGCYDSVVHPVTVYQEELIFIPNVFSPNGDGNNDFFEVFGKKDGWKQFQVQVFNRWGELLYESTDMNFKWEGSYKGKMLEPSVFVYQLYVVYTNNHADKLYKGSLTLVR